MPDLSKLINLLQFELSKEKKKQQQLDSLTLTYDLYKEILNYTDNIDSILENKDIILIILDTLDRDIQLTMTKKISVIELFKRKQMTDLKSYSNAVAVIEKLVSTIRKNYIELSMQISETKKELEKDNSNNRIFELILKKIEYGQYISYNLIEHLTHYLEEKKVSSVELIIYLENIRIYNKNIYEKIHHLPKNYKNDILDMLSLGFEKLDYSEIDYNAEIAKKADFHYSLLKYQKNLDEYLIEIKNEITDPNDLQLFYILMINKIQNEILGLISLIKDKEFYIDDQAKNEIVFSYRRLLKIYLFFRDAYFNTIKIEEQASPVKANIIFAQNPNGKCYFLKDLKSVNNEYLAKVLELIEKLQNGNLANKNIAGFTSLYKEFKKLKDDQIRIVLHQINPSLYCVMGVGVKKDNTGDSLYSLICARKYPKEETEIIKLQNESASTLQEVTDYINQNKRKGNR